MYAVLIFALLLEYTDAHGFHHPESHLEDPSFDNIVEQQYPTLASLDPSFVATHRRKLATDLGICAKTCKNGRSCNDMVGSLCKKKAFSCEFWWDAGERIFKTSPWFLSFICLLVCLFDSFVCLFYWGMPETALDVCSHLSILQSSSNRTKLWPALNSKRISTAVIAEAARSVGIARKNVLCGMKVSKEATTAKHGTGWTLSMTKHFSGIMP